MQTSHSAGRALAAAALGFILPLSIAHAGSSPLGVWMNDTGRGAIEIAECGNALCGHVVWVKDTADTKGCGKQIIGEARPAGSKTWGNGWIYSPEKKRRYDVEFTPLENGTLRVVGYAGVKLFSRTMIWTRAPVDLKRCGGTEVVAKADPAPPATQAEPKTSDVKTSDTKSSDAKAPDVTPPRAETPKVAVPETKTPDIKAAETPAAKSQTAPATPSKAEAATPPVATAQTPSPAPVDKAEKSASADVPSDESGGEDPPELDLKGLKLGNLDLGKVLSRTHDGGCKLNLPWVKVKFACD